MITVTVKLFNLLAIYAGIKTQSFELAEGITIKQLLERMVHEYPAPFKDMIYHHEKISPHLRIFLNEHLLNESEFDAALSDGDNLMLFPAIAGG